MHTAAAASAPIWRNQAGRKFALADHKFQGRVIGRAVCTEYVARSDPCRDIILDALHGEDAVRIRECRGFHFCWRVEFKPAAIGGFFGRTKKVDLQRGIVFAHDMASCKLR